MSGEKQGFKKSDKTAASKTPKEKKTLKALKKISKNSQE
jgi:hypothetical protein